MTYFLNLSSENRLAGETTSSFTVSFNPPIQITSNWEMSLEALSLWYSWYNISPEYNNQIFRYYNGAIWKNIIITPGLYSMENINTFVQTAMKNNGDFTAGNPDVFFISLLPNYNTFKLDIVISGGYQIDLTVGNLYQIFGFTQKIVTSSESGTSNINITNSLNKLFLVCDVVTGGYQGPTNSGVLYSFVANGEPSSLLTIQPNHLIFLPITATNYIYKMRFSLIDNLNRPVNLNGEPMEISLVLRKVK